MQKQFEIDISDKVEKSQTFKKNDIDIMVDFKIY